MLASGQFYMAGGRNESSVGHGRRKAQRSSTHNPAENSIHGRSVPETRTASRSNLLKATSSNHSSWPHTLLDPMVVTGREHATS